MGLVQSFPKDSAVPAAALVAVDVNSPKSIDCMPSSSLRTRWISAVGVVRRTVSGQALQKGFVAASPRVARVDDRSGGCGPRRR